MRPSFILCCAAAFGLVLQGAALAQIGGIAPEPGLGDPPASRRVSRSADRGASAVERASYAADSHAQARPAAMEEVLPGELSYYPGDGPVFSNGWDAPSCGPGCMGCNFCGTRGPSGGPFGRGCLSGFYVRGEYLLWGTKGMNLPALVTTSPPGTPQFDAGVLGEDGTVVLFGGETTGSDMRSGGRITFGWWFDPCQRLGVEADYFGIDDESESFFATSTGNPILARPFYDVVQGVESASLVAFPNLIQGTIAAEHRTSFQGSGVRALYNLCCGDGSGMSCITHCPVHTGYRFDLLAGYRFLRLDDQVGVVEDETSLDTGNPGSFFIRDFFGTENQFHGVDFGTQLNFCKGCFTLDLLSKLALGNTRSVINIAGDTVITQGGASQTFNGGLLAQRTNIGTYEADEFAVVPELGVNLGYQVNPCWRVTVGYTFIYWSRVARAGDQIDRDVNPDLIPPEGPVVTTHLRPEFNLTYDDYWAQGLNLGLEGRW